MLKLAIIHVTVLQVGLSRAVAFLCRVPGRFSTFSTHSAGRLASGLWGPNMMSLSSRKRALNLSHHRIRAEDRRDRFVEYYDRLLHACRVQRHVFAAVKIQDPHGVISQNFGFDGGPGCLALPWRSQTEFDVVRIHTRSQYSSASASATIAAYNPMSRPSSSI